MDLQEFFSHKYVLLTVRCLLIILIGIPLTYMVAKILGRIFKKRAGDHVGLMAYKIILTLGFLLVGITILYELGFNLTALLGAAGVASVAIGFASQTSLSNFISGLFLYGEKPFQVGDVIKIGETSGIVLSIDLMSVKLRQFDNVFVRIPNETMIKSQVSTITKFPIRRMDINVGVAYKEDVKQVVSVLRDLADKNPFCLDEPEPLIVFKDFGDSSLNFMLGMWFEKSDFLKLKNRIMQEIKERFDQEGIEIPFPHRTLYVGSATDPFPVKVVDPVQENSIAETHN